MRFFGTVGAFNEYIDFLKESHKPFTLIEKNNFKKAIWDKSNNLGGVYRGILPDNKSNVWIFKTIRSGAYKFLKKNDPKFLLQQKWPSIVKNHSLINKMDEDIEFLATDIDHCYLAVAHKIGALSDKSYIKLRKPEYKLIRNKAMACLKSRSFESFYNEKGELIYKNETTDKKLGLVYDYIRNEAYRIMDYCKYACGDDFIMYRTDCVYYLSGKKEKNKKRIERYLSGQGFLFNTLNCSHIDKTNFLLCDKDGEFDIKGY